MAAFPTTVATDSDLYIAVNATSTQLTDNPLSNSATTVNVVSTAAFPTVGFISIDNEIIKYTGKTATSFTGCTRGADGTSATSHVQNSQIFHNVVAAHHNVVKDDLIATQQFISDLIGRTSTQLRVPNGSLSVPSISFASDTDTGFKWQASGIVDYVSNGNILATFATNSFQVTDGTAALPGLTFVADSDTGIYRVAANTIGFTTAGTQAFRVDSGNFIISRDFLPSSDASYSLGTTGAGFTKLFLNDGTEALPSFTFSADTDTGLCRTATNTVRLSNGGNATQLWSTSGVNIFQPLSLSSTIRTEDGTASAPIYSFNNDTNTGIYRAASDQISFATNGIQRVTFDNTNWIFGSTATGGTLHRVSIQNDSNTASTDAQLYIEVGGGSANDPSVFFDIGGGGAKFILGIDNSDGDLFKICEGSTLQGNGVAMETTTRNWIPYTDNTQKLGKTGNRWSEVWAGNGTIQTSHSSTKSDIRPLELLPLPEAVRFKRDGREFIGYLNDSIPAEGRPESDPLSNYEMAPIGIALAHIKALEEKVAELEARVK